ncbi:hypothetical protein [Actinokineospora pegani]|uniref:hypothetical protein n=1 Tax=Actinokineospora pegani TaxID=2654637 RepID=UPI0012EAF810|nr:hypothetical protein [Actinokineospora pegani]
MTPRRSPAVLHRRALLRALAAGAVALPLLSACTSDDAPDGPDPLAALAARAESDAAAATAIAAAVPALAAVAGEVARVRAEHAQALTAEVDRVSPPAGTAPATTPPPSAAPQVPADPAAAKAAVVKALADAEQQITPLVATVPRHRAGLIASVAAACAALQEVLA